MAPPPGLHMSPLSSSDPHTAPEPPSQGPRHTPPRTPVDTESLRRVCGHFVTGVTVVTSGLGERAAGTTVNSFTSVSLDPALVLFCLHRASRLRAVVEESRAYAVNLLAAEQEPLARAFAGRATASLDETPHHSARTGVPVLGGVVGYLSCHLVNTVEAGDHTVFVGEVVELGVPGADEEPLVFFRGELGPLHRHLSTTERF
ncbi:flavin reductase family protein [Streptomyces sp. TRM49041]|uniref:flavin reductase family protein n=1 Tax=Streptomyces sp. TRM49041 TaxID=2603216 RepID=UPI0021CD0107|nr:flavin reductase family protein [Streptomyces sp. TRM49041]